MLLPLLVAVTLAHTFTVLTLRRSILTEKVARRGFHLSREYEVDPLEIVFVREVMQAGPELLGADVVLRSTTTAFADDTLKSVVYRMAHTGLTQMAVLDRDTQEPVGLVTLADLLHGRRLTLEAEHRRERVFTFPFSFRPGVM
jgi:hypothetical protein